ncbi:response regulator [Stappia sp.]|uniref:response regulator n=1 Tax=Stappia sp. TaxID=1870903 RepID=UPI0032D973EA
MKGGEQDGQGAAILLVEDDPDDVRIIVKALETSPIPVAITTVDNGHAALGELERISAAGEAPPDLVLLDLNLPVLSGTEFLARLRKHAVFGAIPVCVFTTADDAVTIRRAYAAGANAVVTKADSLVGMSEALHTIVEFWFKVAERYGPN